MPATKELPPFKLYNRKGSSACLVVCDHASGKIPARLKGLGLPRDVLRQYYSHDIGAADVSRHIAKNINACAVLATWSRLVLDLNRAPRSSDSMRDITSDRLVKIPGNRKLTAAEKTRRFNEVYKPFHAAVALEMKRIAKLQVPLLISVHSFTPQMRDSTRPWHIGVMWNHEEKIAKRLIATLRRQNPHLVIGDNQHYSLKGDRTINTVSRHAEKKGYPYIVLEFRQDMVCTPAKARHMGDIFLKAAVDILGDKKTFVQRPVSKGTRR